MQHSEPDHSGLISFLASASVALSSIGVIGLWGYAIRCDLRPFNPPPIVRFIPTPVTLPPPVPRINADDLFAAQCLACHGLDGTGSAIRVALPAIPDFTSAAWQKTQSDEVFIQRINDGKLPTMPAFSGKLNDEQVKALVSYVRQFPGKTSASP
jgi:cytochrome c5